MLDGAARSPGILRRLPANHPSIQDGVAEIKANHDYEMSLGKAIYLDCFRTGMRKRQLTAMGPSSHPAGAVDGALGAIRTLSIVQIYHESDRCVSPRPQLLGACTDVTRITTVGAPSSTEAFPLIRSVGGVYLWNA
ncbi:hypothetical protein CONLIGDRAFT_687667 [Coniochaeta ligniaria NRRL 30616]|uniref:Uncharacterized protein n=1 Tax=Coniochaeta ligniaria NRRL 30616 TaxID=1408157 RepID=A0A1J7I4K3_9PEZI|nr:hypothetical protein CONLIGDRAFT_687667 [Coniochaeta ligniaria NRRL 30616]